MRKRLRVRGTFAPGEVLLQGAAACRSTRVGCEGGGAFGRAGHAVRTGGGAPTGDDPWVVGAPAPGAKAGQPASSFRPGDLVSRHHLSIPPHHVYLFSFSLADQRRQIRW